MNKIKILGIVGSLRQDSYNAFALKAAQALLPNDVALELIDLHGIPLYSQDDEMSPPSAVQALKQRILDADAILFATPECNYSLPGALRNAINWASRPYGETAWKGKPAAVMGASVGSLGTARAQSHLRKMLLALDMPVVNQPEVMICDAAQCFAENGELIDDATREIIQKLLNSLVDLVDTCRTNQAQAA